MTTSPHAPAETAGTADPRTPPQRPPIGYLVVIAVLVLLAGAVGAWALTRNSLSSNSSAPAAATSGALPPGPSLAPSVPVVGASPPSAATPANSSAPSASEPAQPVTSRFRFQPLWPFATEAAAANWQTSSAAGHQPWHLDAGLTAVSFAHDFLRYQEMTRVVSVRTAGDEAWVAVGAAPEQAQKPAAAAVLHLARIGTSDHEPWEVVGTQDTRLSLTTPRYGSTVSSPLTIGGKITGVDESLHVKVFAAGGAQLGDTSGLPAGGDNQRWSATLPFRPTPTSPITVAVSTGGHLREVEAFTITALVVTPAG